ncbi:glycosyltransferase [Limibacter armeniacum]|uniref:glycosyltransferase n=1 Tax=Limibacter armeniacum TaxID=466084 RepID=UPI002FE686E8
MTSYIRTKTNDPLSFSKEVSKTLLLEIAWEVCNQVGGIHTVIRSKVPTAISRWGHENYCLIGPYIHGNVAAVFEPISDDGNDLVSKAVKAMRGMGYEVHYGYWLVAGRPKVVLFNPWNEAWKLVECKKDLWERHKIPSGDGNPLLDNVIMLSEQITKFIEVLSDINNYEKNVIAHFHEWMVGLSIPEIRRRQLPVISVFTTHATILGRYLAMNDPNFYTNLTRDRYAWDFWATHYNIMPEVAIERAAAHGAHVFSTVSRVTANECRYLLGREVDAVMPNGINLERFEAMHHFQNLHIEYKKKIHEFVMGHFFQSYSFDLDDTMYFFTSGRYEYRNKGFDLTLEALARLNAKMRFHGINKTVVAFFITKQPYYSINPHALQSRAVMGEIRKTVDQIQREIGDKLFYKVTRSKGNVMPNLNELVDESMRLRLRRTVQSWKTDSLPMVVTHNLINDSQDEILDFLRKANLVNNAHDRVKVVYHPDFVSSINPLFGMEYNDFVRGCHLGIFPSYYEPWGYTPLECVASGVPAVTSDLAGFGDFVANNLSRSDYEGIYVVKRRHGNFDQSAEDLAETMFRYVCLNLRERIDLRNATERSSVHFDWEELEKYYIKAYRMGLEKAKTDFKVV